MIQNAQFMIQNTLFGTQNTLFVNQMTQNTLLYGILVMVQKILICVLGEHDPRSAQNGRTSSNFWSLMSLVGLVGLIIQKRWMILMFLDKQIKEIPFKPHSTIFGYLWLLDFRSNRHYHHSDPSDLPTSMRRITSFSLASGDRGGSGGIFMVLRL